MTRSFVFWVGVCALSTISLIGCSDTTGNGGSGGDGTAGIGGNVGAAGDGGTAGNGVGCEPVGFDPDCTDPCFQEVINKPGFEQDVLACQKPESLCLQNLGLDAKCLGCYFSWLDCTRFACGTEPEPCDCDALFTECSGIPEVFPGSE